MDKGKAIASSSDLVSKKGKTIADSPTTAESTRKILIKNARQALPDEIFKQIQRKTLDHKEIISKIISENLQNIILTDRRSPRIDKILEAGNWDMKEIEWGITRKVIFWHHDRNEWTKFPALIKYLINMAPVRYNTYNIFEIFSTIGWREETKFYQPYQIWLYDYPKTYRLLNPGYDVSTINYEEYWMNSFLDVVREARQLLKDFTDYFVITDGRRVFATRNNFRGRKWAVNHSRTLEEITEALKLLEKLAYHQNTLDIPRSFLWFANNISTERVFTPRTLPGQS